jgi:catechol 2,3-dioxygenase-like lactoylglutathione lyase family enzyme
MTVSAIHHVNVAANDLEVTRRFYVDAIGLEEGPRPPFAVAGYWLYAEARPIVHIQQAAITVTESATSALNHFAFYVPDLDAALARLDRHGIDYKVTGIPGATARQAFLLDPDGVRIELNPT